MNTQTKFSEDIHTDTNIGNLWHLTQGQRLPYLGAVFAMAATNLCMFAAPIIGGHAIDVINRDDFAYAQDILSYLTTSLFGELSFTGYLWISAIAGVLITAIGALFMYSRGRLAALASENICRNLRESLYQRLHAVNLSFYDTADTGDLVQRCSSDVETIRVFLVSDVIEIGRAIILVVCLVPILFAIHTQLAWLSLVMMPLLTIGAYIFFHQVKKAFQDTDESEAAMTATLQENLTGIRVVRAFARQDYEIEKFAKKNADFRNKSNHLIQLMAYYWSISDFFAMTQLGIVLLAGGYFALQGSLTIGDLFIFMTCEGMVIWPVRQLGRVLTDSGKAVVSLQRINHILNQDTETLGLVPQEGRAKGKISAAHLHLEYANTAALSDFSLDISPGQTIGIVGAPGSGKTTFIRALLGLYPYQQGSLKLDGYEVSGLDKSWLRAQIGVVLQDPFLYSKTIKENLQVGRHNAPDELVQQACEDAALLDSIHHFHLGFEEKVGERGVTLSGGQRQRLALARALLKDPPILVLDDALSAVDTGTEQQILAALNARKGRQTTLVIAHRLSSITQADQIVVLEQGRVVQLGTHDELAQQQGFYQRLCLIQQTLDHQVAQTLQEDA